MFCYDCPADLTKCTKKPGFSRLKFILDEWGDARFGLGIPGVKASVSCPESTISPCSLIYCSAHPSDGHDRRDAGLGRLGGFTLSHDCRLSPSGLAYPAETENECPLEASLGADDGFTIAPQVREHGLVATATALALLVISLELTNCWLVSDPYRHPAT